MPRFFGDVLVRHESRHFRLELRRVEFRVLELVENVTPPDCGHLFPIGRERGGDPSDHVLEIEPQLVGLGLMLLLCRVTLDVATVDLSDHRLEIVLTNRGALQIRAAEVVCRASRFPEIPLDIGDPRTGIDSVAQLRLGQLGTGNVDSAKPLESLAVSTAAFADRELVIENSFLLVLLKVMEMAILEAKSPMTYWQMDTRWVVGRRSPGLQTPCSRDVVD